MLELKQSIVDKAIEEWQAQGVRSLNLNSCLNEMLPFLTDRSQFYCL